MHEMVQAAELLKLLIELLFEIFLIAKLAIFNHPFAKHYGWLFRLDQLKDDFVKLNFCTREWDIYFKVYIWRRIVKHITICRLRMFLASALCVCCFIQLTLGGLWAAHLFENINQSDGTINIAKHQPSNPVVNTDAESKDDVKNFLESAFVWSVRTFFGWPLILLLLITYVAHLAEPEAQFLLDVLHPADGNSSPQPEIAALHSS